MEEKAEKIYEILQDYHCDYPDTSYEMSPDHILKWANQFGEDADFVLSEFLYFLPKIYVSKSKARTALKNRLANFQEFYGYHSMGEFILNVHLIDVQRNEKSQKEILILIKAILQDDYGVNYDQFADQPKKHFIYFDDVLATGGTIFRDLQHWLVENFEAFVKKEKTIALSLFCYHELGYGNMKWMLIQNPDLKALFDKYSVSGAIIEKELVTRTNYIIENQAKWNNQKLNCAFPIADQSKEVLQYLANFSENPGKAPVFRASNTPVQEIFFSGPDNRNRLEKIFTEKGLELLQKVNSHEIDQAKRPLGYTVRSHKTLGTGTLFFTWRNISNTCPLVFWWDVPGHQWTPLFCLKNRGI